MTVGPVPCRAVNRGHPGFALCLLHMGTGLGLLPKLFIAPQ